MTPPSHEQVNAALAQVDDPEIRRPITELGMVESIGISPAGVVAVRILLTVVGCPMRDRLTSDVTAAVRGVGGVTDVLVSFGVMDDQQRTALQESLRGGHGQATRDIPFGRPGSLTKVFAIASGKGGVGKSSVTVNIAVAMARSGRKVGVVDADIYGHSVPAMLGIADVRPTQVEELIMPVPTRPWGGSADDPSAAEPASAEAVEGAVEGPSVISIGMLKPRRDQVVAWRGPMLDRALVQMLSDVYWGDLDVLLLDLPPGTGDIAISLGQHLPSAEVLVVTTPQEAAAEVAERAGTMASMMHQRVIGVVENMSYLACPHCTDEGREHRLEVFGSGGGRRVAATLSQRFGYDVPVLGEIPLDIGLRAGGDVGSPIVVSEPDSPAARELTRIASGLSGRGRKLAGLQLGLTPAGKF